MDIAGLALLLCAASFGATPGGSGKDREPPVKMPNHRQLFVDDHVIAQMQGVKRVLNQPKKHPANPLLRCDRPWEGMTPFLGTVLYDEERKLFGMWYVGFAPGKRPGCYATSADGIHWAKPALGLVAFEGSKANNLIPWSSMSMVYSPEDSDPARRYKSLAGRRGQWSPDGLKWDTPAGSKNIPGDIASDNVISVCYDNLNGRYVAFAKVVRQSGKHLRRSVSVSFSEDFLAWTPVETALVPDARDDELARQRVAALRDRVQYDDGPDWHVAQFYRMDGFVYEGMYLGLLEVFDISGWAPGMKRRPAAGGEDGPAYIELTSSRDLRSWNRVCDHGIFIPVGKAGTWEAGWIDIATPPLIVGDEIWIYYGGMMVTHGDRKFLHAEGDGIAKAMAESKAMGGMGAIGLATLRLDGWVSVDAGKKPGTLTTKPLVFQGDKKLVINARAPKGAVSVEILDEAGKSLGGFGKGDCQVFNGDAIRHTVTWDGKSALSSVAGKPVRLRFHLREAKLYSFVFEG